MTYNFFTLFAVKVLPCLILIQHQQANTFSGIFTLSPNVYSYSSYQKGIVCNPTHNPIKPGNLSEIQQIIQQALHQNLTVKPVGNLYSITDIICTDGVPLNMEKINHFHYDPESELVTIGAGSTIFHLITELHRFGRALEGMPAFSGITVGGALATGAHGSSLKRRTTISSQVVALTIVDGLGVVKNISMDENGHLFHAFKTHLGLLGIIYQVMIRTVPQYKVKIRNKIYSESVMFQDFYRFKNQAKSSDFFQFFWFPTAGNVVVSKGLVTKDINTTEDCEVHLIPDVSWVETSLYGRFIELMQKFRIEFGLYLFELFNMKSLVQPMFGKTPIFLQRTRNSENLEVCHSAVGFSHKMLANKCNECPWDGEENSISFDESSIIIPLSELQSALETIRTTLRANPTQFYLNGIFFRFLAPSSNEFLSFEGNQESVSIEWVHTTRQNRFKDARIGLEVTQALLQALVHKHRGRAHWGKNGLYYSSPKMIRLQYGEKRVRKYVEAMEHLDPFGVFLNDFGRRIKFGMEKMTLETQALQHCALSDHCVCKSNLDCGGKNGGRVCGKLGPDNEFNVCNRKSKGVGNAIFTWINQRIIQLFQLIRSKIMLIPSNLK